MTDPNRDLGAPIVPAATILLLRDRPSFEVLMVQRHHQIDFAAGALVFPGGKTHASDHDPRWPERALGWEAASPEQGVLRVSALREAYEETGILLARRPDGSPFRGDDRVAAARAAITAEPEALVDLLGSLDLRLDLGALTVFARWITPQMMPKRFDTWFYVASAPPDQLAICDGHETVDATWVEPGEALRLGATGQRSVIFPTRLNLRLLNESKSAGEAAARAAARQLVTVEPRLEDRSQGRFMIIPADAGYGDGVFPASDLP